MYDIAFSLVANLLVYLRKNFGTAAELRLVFTNYCQYLGQCDYFVCLLLVCFLFTYVLSF